MKVLVSALLATAAMAAPAPTPQKGGGGGGYCFVFARGSTEPSPLGMTVGPALERALKAQLPGLRTIPVKYAARLDTNMSAQRTDAASISKGIEAFKQASGCGKILAGGYSQGAAVMHNVVPKLDGSIKGKIVGVALFGDTRNKQDNGHIPNFPSQKSRVWCNKNDGVCGGGLNVNAGHMAYTGAPVKEATSWLVGLAKGGGGGGGPPAKSSGGGGKAPKGGNGGAPKSAKGGAKGKGS